MPGALDILNNAINEAQGYRKRALDYNDAATREGVGALSRPYGGGNGALAMAAGFLSPTRSGSFAEGLGNAARGYEGAAEYRDEMDMSRAQKIMALKAAQAKLMNAYGGDVMQFGINRMQAPGLAKQYLYDKEDYDDELSGDARKDIPQMPTPGGGGGGGTPTPTAAPPAATGGPAGAAAAPGPNGGVGANPSLSAVAQAAQNGQIPAQYASLLGNGDGPDAGDAAFAGQEPQRVNVPVPGQGQQVAQAVIPGSPEDLPPTNKPNLADPSSLSPSPSAGAIEGAAKPAPNSYEAQLYNWAQQVRMAATRDPARWARRPRNVAAMKQADQIIQAYEQHRQLDIEAAAHASTARAQETQTLEAQRNLKDPTFQARLQNDQDVLKKAAAEEAGGMNAIGAATKLEAARANMGWKSGFLGSGVGEAVLSGMDAIPGVDSGRGRLQEATRDALKDVIGEMNNGPISDGERKIFASMVAGGAMKNESAHHVTEAGILIGQRRQEYAQFVRRYYQTWGTTEGADEKWAQYSYDHPILSTVDATGKQTPEGTLREDNLNKWQDKRYLTPPTDYIRAGRIPQWKGAVPEVSGTPTGPSRGPGAPVTPPMIGGYDPSDPATQAAARAELERRAREKQLKPQGAQ